MRQDDAFLFLGGEEFLKKHFLCQTFFNKQKVTTKA